MSIHVTLSKNPDFGQNYRKIAILVKIFENLDCEDFRNTSILVKIFENLDFGQNFRIYRLWTKFSNMSDFEDLEIRDNFKFGHNFRKTSISLKTSRFWSNCPKISILVKIFEKS